jgi:hypothetical protein
VPEDIQAARSSLPGGNEIVPNIKQYQTISKIIVVRSTRTKSRVDIVNSTCSFILICPEKLSYTLELQLSSLFVTLSEESCRTLLCDCNKKMKK